jgi:hypothetical protein
MKIVPHYSLKHVEFFVDAKFNAAEPETVAPGRTVLSAPLVFDKMIPLLELAKTDMLLEDNVVDYRWTADPEKIRLDSVRVEFPGLSTLVGSNIGLNVADAVLKPGAANKPHVLTILKKTIPVVVGLTELAVYTGYNERTEQAPLLQEVAQRDLHLVYSLHLSASMNLGTGGLRVIKHSFELKAILDKKGRTLEIEEDAELKRIADYARQAKAAGFFIDADWCQTSTAERYQFEMGDPNPIGRGLALLIRAHQLSAPAYGYAAEVTEPSADMVGKTKLYMQPTDKDAEQYVIVEEGFDLPPGECNIEFFGLVADWQEAAVDQKAGTWLSLGRWEQVTPGMTGHWVSAISEFLLDSEEYYLTGTLPDSIPEGSGHRVR